MKKVIAFSVLMIALSAVHSQTLRIGVKAGANLTKVTGKAFKEEFDLSYQAGAFAEVGLNKSIGIQPEILFNQVSTQKASTTDQVFNDWKQDVSSIQLKYLTIPVLLRINVNDLVSINMGPQFGILLNKNESLWSSGKEAFKTGDLSVVGGLTVNLKVLRVYGRYVIGLNNINDIQNTDTWKSQQIQLGIGLKL